MEDYNELLSDHSSNEEAHYSDQIDSDIEAELYGLIHHDAQDDISLQDKSDSVEIDSVSLQDKSFSTKNSVLYQNSTYDNSVLSLTNSTALEDTVNSAKKGKKSVKKNKKNCRASVKTNHTDFFSSDTIISNNNLYFSFESPVRKMKIQHHPGQSENTERNVTPSPAKQKSDVVSKILENIQLKKSMHLENSISKKKRNNLGNSSMMTEKESFVEVIDDSSNSDSDSSIIFLEPDQSKLATNITKETVDLSSDFEDSDSSTEKILSQACQKQQMHRLNEDINPSNKDLWHINSEDKFRTKKQSGRYHENAVVTCSNCQLKGHSAKFCSVPKAMKCFFCGDYHSGMNCKNKICTKCFQQGHDRRRCYIRYIETCELCRMRGHSDKNCPDIWRRYHMTTSKGRIVKGNPNPHTPLYCYNCGSKGHYGAECMESRVDRWSFPTWTSVISYQNPTWILQREQQRNSQENTRNFNERSEFVRTPLFRRRKGNETLSNDTPRQNTKKKKKKKSPKTPPNINHHSASRAQNIVHNEVYFPRTPKLTKRASIERFLKRKQKISERERLLRQQAAHRIELQERLGLSFPTTI